MKVVGRRMNKFIPHQLFAKIISLRKNNDDQRFKENFKATMQRIFRKNERVTIIK